MDDLRDMSKRRVNYGDLKLIDVARKLNDLPSARKFIKLSRHFMKTRKAEAVDVILEGKKSGFWSSRRRTVK